LPHDNMVVRQHDGHHNTSLPESVSHTSLTIDEAALVQ